MDALVNVACDVAMKAAVKWMDINKQKADTDALIDCLRANVKIRLPQALKEAKAALDCNMGKIAEQTFAATMALAGIDAAKEASYPAEWPTPAGPR